MIMLFDRAKSGSISEICFRHSSTIIIYVMSSKSSIIAAYRSILREVVKSSISPRKSRSPVVASSFRTLFRTERPGVTEQEIVTQAENAVTFMRAQREYQELLIRYNPLHDLSPEEHRVATAHRVGLNMPKQYNE
ncbi:hypothetical protein FRC03_006475 [Tulasnella sp. 419]|nr:hypothetical protein FRC03_006475 [Tulasnella sp. 419]